MIYRDKVECVIMKIVGYSSKSAIRLPMTKIAKSTVVVWCCGVQKKYD